METRSIMVNGMSCDHCTRAVRAEIGRLPGVAEVDVDVAAGRVRITGQSLPGDAALRDAVKKPATSSPDNPVAVRPAGLGRPLPKPPLPP